MLAVSVCMLLRSAVLMYALVCLQFLTYASRLVLSKLNFGRAMISSRKQSGQHKSNLLVRIENIGRTHLVTIIEIVINIRWPQLGETKRFTCLIISRPIMCKYETVVGLIWSPYRVTVIEVVMNTS